LTPRELSALLTAYEGKQRMENYRAGIIAAILYNQNRKRGATAMEPLDFFGGKSKEVQTPAEIRSQLTAWAAVVNRKA
jgi:hypothetical protein